MTNNDVKKLILDLILSNKLFPGQRLSIKHLSNELNISQTPIREILSNLSKDEIILHRPHQGFFMPCYDESEIAQLYDFLFILIEASLKKVIEQLDKIEIQSLINQSKPIALLKDDGIVKDTNKAAYVVESILGELASISKNKFIKKSMETCIIKTYFTRRIEYKNEGRVEQIRNDLIRIVFSLNDIDNGRLFRRILDMKKNKRKYIHIIYKEYVLAIYRNALVHTA